MWVLMHPQKTQREIARDLGYTEAWLSTLMASDIFKDRMAEMQDTYHSTVFLGIRSRAEMVATLALNRMEEALTGDDVSPGYALEAATKLLQYVDRATTPTANAQGVVVNVGIATEIHSALASIETAARSLPAPVPVETPDAESQPRLVVEPA